MKKTTLLRAFKMLVWKHIKTQPHAPTAPARRAGALSLLVARRACLWTALGLLAALAFGAQSTRAAVVEGWVHRYSNVVSNSNDQAVKVVRVPAGDIIVTGFTQDGVTGGDMLLRN